MTETERLKRVLEVLRDRPFASVRDLQSVLDASPATIRRDIAKLHATGAVRKLIAAHSRMSAAAHARNIQRVGRHAEVARVLLTRRNPM